MGQRKPRPKANLSPNQPPFQRFESELEVFGPETDEAVRCYASQRALIRHLLSSQEAFRLFMRAPKFWDTALHSFDRSMHITLSKIFEHGQDTFNINRLINLTRSNLDLFSLDALRLRLQGNFYTNEQVDHFLSVASVPTVGDLNTIVCDLKPHRQFHLESLHPLRTNLHGHRIVQYQQDIDPELPLFVDLPKVYELIGYLSHLHRSLFAAYSYGLPLLPLRDGTHDESIETVDKEIERLVSEVSSVS